MSTTLKEKEESTINTQSSPQTAAASPASTQTAPASAAGSGNTTYAGSAASTGEAPGAYSGLQQKLESAAADLENWDDFSYDINGDALYRQYRDIFERQGKTAMMDTMAQTSALTGGYANSYAQSAGQQAYGQSLSQLSAQVPELYELAYRRHQDEWQKRLDRYNLYSGLEQQQYQRQQENYGRLYNAIVSGGYSPSDAQLAAVGMSRGEADALRLGWAKADPDSAYRGGFIGRDEYYLLTGRQNGGVGYSSALPEGYSPPASVTQQLDAVKKRLSATSDSETARRDVQAYLNYAVANGRLDVNGYNYILSRLG